MSFAARIRPRSRRSLHKKTLSPGGTSPEAIWHQYYDTQTYTDNSTTRLTFFQSTNTDATITNMPAAGQLPAPQFMQLHHVTCDFLVQVTGAATTVTTGVLDDLALLILVGRPNWTLTISDKKYGPYSLSALHGTGGPSGVAVEGAAQIQFGTNCLLPGWNYNGSLTIPPNTNFNIEVVWSAAQNLTGNVLIRLSLFGVLHRRVL